MSHSLYPFFTPQCIAVVGASDRYGSTGRSVFGRLSAMSDKTVLLPINPQHKTIAGHKSFESLSEAAKEHHIDTVIVVLAAEKLAAVLREMGKLGIRQAVMINETDPTPPNIAAKLTRASETASKNGIRLLAVPVSGLDGLFAPSNHRATLSYIGHSAGIADCLDSYARERAIGFNRFLTLNPLNYPISTGQIIDFIAAEDDTSALLVHIARIDHAQELLSALTAAARNKPLVVLPTLDDSEQEQLFLQALERNHILTVHTLADFLSAAKLIHTGLFSRGNKLGIISNTPQITALSIKNLPQLDLALSRPTAATLRIANKLLPHKAVSDNPFYLPQDAAPAIFQAATEAFLQDENTDAVLLLYAGFNTSDNLRVAKMTSALQARFRKPLLLVWVGSADTSEIRHLFNQQKNLHFRQPEHALHALTQLNRYRNHQQQRHRIAPYFDYTKANQAATELNPHLQAWLPVAVLPVGRNGTNQLLNALHIHKLSSRKKVAHELTLEWQYREPFGQLLTLYTADKRVQLLPPPNPEIIHHALAQLGLDNAVWHEHLLHTVELLTRLPQIHDLTLKLLHEAQLGLCCTEIKLNLQDPDSSHRAPNIIAPYPHFIGETLTLPNGETAYLRPLRPEDALLLQNLVAAQSDHHRQMRFMSKFKTLPTPLLARLSTPDYNRDFSIIITDSQNQAIATAGYTADPDQTSCEFGIITDERHQGSGLGRTMMNTLIRFARRQNFHTMRAEILTDNHPMQKLALKLDFVLSQNPHDPNIINAVLEL